MNAPIEDKRYRLLVVDDNRAIHEDFQKILTPDIELKQLDQIEADLFGKTIEQPSRQDFVVDSAYQGQDGLKLVEKSLTEKNPYALAFIDMRMPPGWNGIETIEHIWAVDPELQIVICSAYSDHSWAEISQRLGNSDRLLILKKPFDNVEILQMAYAMSTKCLMAREQKLLSQYAGVKKDLTIGGSIQTRSLEDTMDRDLLGPIEDIKENVKFLQISFKQLNSQFSKLRNALAAKTDLTSEQNIQDLLSLTNIPDLEQSVPNTFHRLNSALKKVRTEAKKPSDKPGNPIH